MTYVERILRMQAEVAAELQPEADEALAVYHWSARVRPEAGTQDAEPEPGTAEALSLPADMQTPDRPGLRRRRRENGSCGRFSRCRACSRRRRRAARFPAD